MAAAKPRTVHQRLDEHGETLAKILTQTTQTNGRVGRLEEEVFGDPSHDTPGLIAETRTLKKIVFDARAVALAVKWGLPVLGVSNVAVLIKVLAS